MPFRYQVLDILIGGLLAGLGSFVFGAVVQPSFAVALGSFFAAMFYFSRNPWGMQEGAELNDRIDDLYERVLP